MKEKIKIIKKNGINNVLLRTWIFISLITAVVLNIFLAVQHNLEMSVSLLFIISFLISITIINIIKDKQSSTEFKELENNINEAQKIINESTFKAFSYGKLNRNTVNYGISNLSLLEIITDPLSWFLCFTLFLSFFFTSTYSDFEFNNLVKIIKFIFLTLLQIGMASFAITGILILAYKKITGDK